MNELDIAKQVASGELPSPTVYMNSGYVALRISGTGCCWRRSVKEFAIRSPEIWLTPQMERRWLGAPAVIDHPAETGVLNSNFYGDRTVGSIVHSWSTETELWSVTRILDAGAYGLIKDGKLHDTSPGIVLAAEEPAFVEYAGARILVEGEVALVDHLALCGLGVWTRAGMAGVITEDTALAEREAVQEVAPK